jgi:hypothetical protein
MAFEVETGSGSSTANSYLSVADADTYHNDHSGSTDWNGAATADKEKALRLATQYLDIKHDGKWQGYRSNQNQALAWPRSNVADNDGYYYGSDEIPQRLKDAVAELALRVIQGDTLLDDISKPGTIKSKSVKAGPVQKTTEYVGGMFQVKKYPLIEGLIQHLIESTGCIERG